MTKQLTQRKHLSRPLPETASVTIARDLLRLVRQHGGDPAMLLADAGLDQRSGDLLAGSGGETALPHTDFARLYAHCTWQLDAAAARQEGRDPVTKQAIDLMCHCLITARTMREAILRAAAFSELLAPRMARLTLSERDGVARVEMATERRFRNACAYVSDVTGMSMFHRLFGWLIGEQLALSSVEMCYEPLLDPRSAAHLMLAPIRHRGAANAICFPADRLERGVIRNAADLDRLLAHFPFDLAEPQSIRLTFSDRLRNQVSAALAGGEAAPMAGSLAHQFGCGIATLKRRLAQEGTSLAMIKRSARYALACHLLADERLAVTEVARRLHFSDAGAFRRAFRQWSGASPTKWRRTIRPAAAGSSAR